MGIKQSMTEAFERSESIYAYDDVTTSGAIVDTSAISLHYVESKIEFPSTTISVGFLTRDPIGYAAGDANVYRFAFGNAPIGLDPLGLEQPWHGYPGPHIQPTPPRTPDQNAAYAACAGISGSRCGGNCNQSTCEAAVDAFIKAVNDSWVLGIPFLGPLGPNTCERKANDIVKRIPKLKNNPCVVLLSVAMQNDPRSVHPWRTPSHSWATMVLCNCRTINGDNGANGGDDQIWVGNPLNNQD